ncbi:glycosyl hydrolase family 18 protein [Shimazuella sp. AN120528]|uniref:glycosyl hydrolase family 18 protein n=1 Tax=Shimazuella soli TaxID=1892854 RepID=UPI001F0DB6BB|nr:glycosyl hydrolase family 18 protein [Shimazuella soli]MCH5586073.1 glycosyl hydrolase family 18 protein [Shimazuella soli]
MRKIYLLFMVLFLLITGCNLNMRSSEKSPYSKRLSNHITRPKIKTMSSKGRTVPVKRGENTLPIKAVKPTIESIGFLEPINPSQAISDIKQTDKSLTYIANFSYQAQANGDLTSVNDSAAIKTIKRHRATPMLVITNFANGNFQPAIAHRLFTDPIASKNLVHNVIQIMKQKGYQALNVDFEHIYVKDRQLYNQFLATLLPAVKNEGFLVSTALAPKTSDKQSGPWHGAHDYAFHGQIADFVILMTYEWGWTGGPPMAVSPIPQVRKVIDYAITKIPRDKIIMGAPLYGYDWKLPYIKNGPKAKRVSPQEAETFAQVRSIKVQYSNQDQAPYYVYTDDTGKKHIIWFENTQSAQAKFNLIKSYGLRGIAYWVLGENFPKNWQLLQDNFIIKKR